MGTEHRKFFAIRIELAAKAATDAARRASCSSLMVCLRAAMSMGERSTEMRRAGPPSPLEYGSSRACKCRWAPYVRDHDPGQGQLPVSTIKAPGYRIPDARGSTRPKPI